MGVTVYPELGFPPGMVAPYAGAVAPEGWLLCDGAYVLRTDYPALFTAVGTAYNIGGDADATRFRLPNLKGRVIAGVDTAQTEFAARGTAGGAKTVVLTEANMPSHAHTLSHTHGMNSVNTNHAHNVYTRNQDTGTVSSWHTHNFDHWHVASIGNVHYLGGGAQAHQHGGGAGWAAESPSPNHGQAAAVAVNVTGTGGGGTGNPSANHSHNFNHDHPSTNYASESPWPGIWDHAHTTNSQSATTTSSTGSSSAHENLPPYLTMNYLIKT